MQSGIRLYFVEMSKIQQGLERHQNSAGALGGVFEPRAGRWTDRPSRPVFPPNLCWRRRSRSLIGMGLNEQEQDIYDREVTRHMVDIYPD